MSTINFKIYYNSVKTTNPEMGSEVLSRKSRYILENKLVFDDPVILQTVIDQKFSEDISKKVSSGIRAKTEIGEFLLAAARLILYSPRFL